ncbi:MAG: CotH kinase family protein, partial [Bacteroidaceae bacterium]|nr:CotH kinase family protein [Bacteroidaceae bacterium]
MKLFRSHLILFILTLLPISSKGASWTAPTMPTNEGLPPMGEQIYLLHTGRQMFLTKGTTWGTHAALTDDPSSALPYIIYDLGSYQRLYSPKAGNKRYLFLNDGTEGNVYTDYNGQDITCSYWKLQAVNNGHFRIMLASENVHTSTLPNYRLGWNPNNVDKNENGSSLGTNIGIFAVSPTATGNETEWTYITDQQYAEYKQRCILYNLHEQAMHLGMDVEDIGAVYDNPSSTAEELESAATALQFLLSQADTDYIINPNFDGSVSGWTVNMPGAQNKGYQGSSYTNGGISISHFAEAWVPNSRTLGAGEIYQTITNLPEGTYMLEADVIACNQNGDIEASGVYLFARNQTEYEQAVSSHSAKPQHFSLEFYHQGGNLTLGLKTLDSTNANWVAFDNVRLRIFGVVPKPFSNDPTPLVINELQTANIDMFIDPSFNYGGWVELYNPTDKHINLGNVFISDEALNPLKHQLPTDMGYVPSKGYKVVWFDHYTTADDYSQSDVAYKQVPFKLDYEGGKIFFSNSDGQLFLSLEYPHAIQRVSYARTTDGTGTWGMTSTPTPGASNNGSAFASEQLSAPVIDKDACVFTTPFTAQVSIPNGATLRYTLDGSTPTLANGITSSNGSFSIAKNTILRLRLYQDGYLPSAVITRSYIYADKDYYLPIVSVVTDDRNLNDNTIGAYVDGTNGTSGNNHNFSNKNRNWERPVNFEYLVPNNQEGDNFLMAINQECDFEVSGGWSRHFSPASSFRLKGNKYCLGQNAFDYPFFPEKPYIKNKALQLRNGGNDNNGRIRDAATHQILITSGFYNDCQAWQPVHIFINGQYKFMFNLREPNNKNHGYSNYGIDTDLMDQFEINGTKGYEQKSGDDASFRQWMSLAEQLGNDPENEVLYKQICDLVDIDEYINYMAAECYVGSSDWLTNSNNVKGYREKKNGAKFHLVFMDLDSGFGSTNMIGSLQGHLYDSRYDTGKNFLIDIFLNMLKNPTFKKRFIDAFCLVHGSVFESVRSTEIINSMASMMEKAMGFDGHQADTRNSANSLISAITSSSNRSARINSIVNYFGLGSAYDVKLSTNLDASRLQLNGQEIPTNKFDGNLFAPVTLSAIAPAGYKFKGWALTGAAFAGEDVFTTNDTWKYYDQGSLDGQNWKSNSYSENGWKSGQAPLGYGNVGINGSSDYNTTLDYGTDSSNKRPTYYFRKAFTLDKAPTDDDIYQLTYYVDDGFIAYVNGTEVGRYLMNDGNAVYSDYSNAYAGATAATATITIDNSLLLQGNNIIAVEVHNTSASSSDIYWTARLVHSGTTGSGIVSTSKDFTLSNLNTGSYTLEAQFEPIPEEALIDSLSMPIRVNEVSAGNSIFVNDTFLRNDWIELYNTTDSDLDAAGLYISDDPDDVLKYQITSSPVLNTVIPAHGHRILWADNLV